jgi:hypothetical protein
MAGNAPGNSIGNVTGNASNGTVVTENDGERGTTVGRSWMSTDETGRSG